MQSSIDGLSVSVYNEVSSGFSCIEAAVQGQIPARFAPVFGQF